MFMASIRPPFQRQMTKPEQRFLCREREVSEHYLMPNFKNGWPGLARQSCPISFRQILAKMTDTASINDVVPSRA